MISVAMLSAYSIPEGSWYNGKIVAVCYAVLGLPLCLHGWGGLFLKVFRMADESPSIAMGAGLAGLLFIGGILNLIGFAYPPAFVCLFIIGFVKSVGGLWLGWPCVRIRAKEDFRKTVRCAPVYILIAFITGATALCLLPSQVFNIYDDFEKYFVYPVRMLQTGSLFGSPLSAIGSETLGGKAFLDGFIIVFLPIKYMNATDQIVGFLICLILVAQLGQKNGPWYLTTIASVLCVTVINPQCVNTSALYLGSALIVYSIALTMNHLLDIRTGFFPKPAMLALGYAGMISLKSTFALFPTVHLLLVTSALAASNKNLRSAFVWFAQTSFWLLLFISPWLLLHASHFLARPHRLTGSAIHPLSTFAAFNPFASKQLLYGDSIAHYTWIALLAPLTALVAVRSNRHAKEGLRQNLLMLMAAAATGVIIYILDLGMVPTQVGMPGAVRYFAPFIIGIAPPVFTAAALHLNRDAAKAQKSTWVHRFHVFFPATAALLACMPFAATSFVRAKRAMNVGSILAFPVASKGKSYYDYNRQVLDGPIRKTIEDAQQTVPKKMSILVWIDAPFYMNFSRNKLFEVDVAGLTQRWANIPSVQYAILQHSGLAYMSNEKFLAMARLPVSLIREQGEVALRFREYLQSMIEGKLQTYENGSITVYNLEQPKNSE